MLKDFVGNTVQVGDYIFYTTRRGRCLVSIAGEVIGFQNEGKWPEVKVVKANPRYYKKDPTVCKVRFAKVEPNDL